MKSRLLLVLFFFLSCNLPAEDKVKKTKYPEVTEVSGEAKNLGHELKAHVVLSERASLETGNIGRIEVALDGNSKVIVAENSLVDLPVITFGDGEVFEVRLQHGRLYYKCEKVCRRSLSTALSKDVFQEGDYWLKYQSESPYVEVFVIHGEQEFGGLENENTVKVSTGKKVVFQGVKEDGEVSYDHLLKGHVAARGQLMPVQDISEKEMKDLFAVSQKTKKVAVAKATPTPPEKAICQKPFGTFNQCWWTKIGKNQLCQRSRCDANGNWSDTQSVANCGPQEKIANCDY